MIRRGKNKNKTQGPPPKLPRYPFGCHEIFSIPSPSHRHQHDSFILLLPRHRCPLQQPLPFLPSFHYSLSFHPQLLRGRCPSYEHVLVWQIKEDGAGWPPHSTQEVDKDEIYWRNKKDDDEELEWSGHSAHVISHLVQCFTNAMVGPRSWIGGLVSRFRRNDRFADFPFNPLQEQRLLRLQERLHVPFDETRPDHQEALTALWDAAFPNVVLQGLISDQWKEMGWQGPNPSTDFRGCGFVSLENLLFFARTYPKSFHRLLFKQGGQRATWEYPFAVAGINVTFMLIQMLDLYSDKPRCLPGFNFIKLLGENEEAFDVLYCVAFEMMDAQWLAMHASYMEFNEVLRVTRIQLERELSLEDVHCIQDLPAYNLLFR